MFAAGGWPGSCPFATLNSNIIHYYICPRSRDPFYIVAHYIRWVTTSWIDGIRELQSSVSVDIFIKERKHFDTPLTKMRPCKHKV